MLNVSFFPFVWGNDSLMSAAKEAPSAYPWGAATSPGVPATTGKLRDTLAPATEIEPDFALEHHIYFDEHHLPIWNRLASFGMPLAADMQSQPYFPLTALVVAAPSPRLHALWVLTRLLLAGTLAFCFLRLFVAFWPAIGGATLFLYTGYFLLFINIGHLSVETLLPGVFLAHEKLLRRRSATGVAALATVTALVLLGGMPESALIVLASGVAYWCWRIWALRAERRSELALRDMAVSSLAGCGLAGFLILPFLEFARFSLNQHDNPNNGMTFGGFHVPFDVHVLTYVAPLLFGPMGNIAAAGDPAWFGPDGFFGVAALLLALVGLTAAVRSTKSGDLFGPERIAGFFFVVALFAFLKRFGSPAVQWIGALPLFSLLDFLKYDEPVLGFALAVLAAIGMDRLMAAEGRRRATLPAIALTLLVLTAGYAATASIGRDASPSQMAYYVYAWSVAFSAFTAVALLAAFGDRLRGAAPILLVAVCFLESLASYLVPMYYFANQPATVAENPYRIPPYAAYLRNHVRADERVMGFDGNLYPMWAAAYGLGDPEDVDALYPKNYLTFARTFLSSTAVLELLDRFTGTGVSVWDTPLERRFLTLSSIAYVITTAPIPANAPGFDDVYAGDARIYHVRDVLPRAAVFYNVAAVDKSEAALKLLADTGFDVRKTATVLATTQTRSGLAALQANPAARSVRAAPASIVSSDSEQTTIEATAQYPGFLVYNDSNFPGWKASVDGAPAPILDANFLFRGVFVPAGKHIVRFTYEPASLRDGFLLSVASVLIIALYCRSLRTVLRRQRPT
jgi:hypothetical protein